MLCLDKTGTLSEADLDIFGAIPSRISDRAIFEPLIPDISQAEVPLLQILASCHSLAVVKGTILGDPLDVKMFKASRYMLQEKQFENLSMFTTIGE